jgi:threonine synthase
MHESPRLEGPDGGASPARGDTAAAGAPGESDPCAGGTDWTYRCARCAQAHRSAHTDYCVSCGAPVLAAHTPASEWPLAGPGPGLWRYAAHVPVRPEEAWLGASEGRAPVVRVPELAERAGVREVLLALDHVGPTGSFKDRAAVAGVAHAVEHDVGGVVCASSGNAAASAAAYAARAGLPAVLVVPEDTPAAKLSAAEVFGAEVLRVPGDYSRSFELARDLCARLGFANLATTYVNPTAVAALRTVAFEMWRRIDGPIDRVVVPTGAGALVHGVAGGFRRLVSRGELPYAPRVDAVQLRGCAPIVQAFDRDQEKVQPWGEVTTRISGLGDPLRGYPEDGAVTLGEVRGSDGVAVAVQDDSALAAQRRLARHHGVFVEPAAAVAVAGLLELAARARLSPDDVVVCLLTGHGLKTLDHDTGAARRAPLVRTAEEAVDRCRARLG